MDMFQNEFEIIKENKPKINLKEIKEWKLIFNKEMNQEMEKVEIETIQSKNYLQEWMKIIKFPNISIYPIFTPITKKYLSFTKIIQDDNSINEGYIQSVNTEDEEGNTNYFSLSENEEEDSLENDLTEVISPSQKVILRTNSRLDKYKRRSLRLSKQQFTL